MSRLGTVEGETFDVAIVGGGIIGCGIARDAALRGLRVVLFESRDFGSGTTSASTRIVHGGLRYLEMLDFRLVRLDLREREILLRIAPHLVRPLEFLIPFFNGDLASPLKLRLGLALYDALSFDKSLPSRRWLRSDDARSADAALVRSDIHGAAAYHDARVDSPERLALENVLDAEVHGARAFNYCEVMGASAVGTGLRVRDRLSGVEMDVRARAIVNATGAWFERAAAALTGLAPGRVRTTKGIHIVVKPLTKQALVLYSQVDRRLLFAIPRHDLTWIGTTDTDYVGDPADARATRGDVDYLIDSVRHIFPALTRDAVLYTTAGVRALVKRSGSESSVSRMHKVIEGAPMGNQPVISVLGGKITGYRAIAEEATDAVCRRLGIERSASETAARPLPGARPAAAGGGLPPEWQHLYDLYGTRAAAVVSLARSTDGLDRQLSPEYPDIAAQVVFSTRFEHCVRLSDFLRRRSLLGASADQGLAAAPAAAALMGRENGWSQARVADELDSYRREVAATQEFRNST